jgi:uncharacterized membrane protein
MNALKVFLTVLVLGPALDFAWFSLIASDLYKRALGPILRMKEGVISANLWVALPVYVLIAALVTFFVLPKVGAGGSFLSIFFWGALAGLILYGTYDLTNMSFIKDWTWTMTIADMLWGTFMVGIMAVIAAWVERI